MTSKKPKYLSYKDVAKVIDENSLQYLVMIGQRSNGKSYAAKELAIRNAFSKNEEFTYLRRRKEDLQDYMIVEYFADMMDPGKDGKTAISKITRGEYSTITVYRKGIYLANVVEDKDGEKIVRGKLIGYAHALSGLEGLKSRQFPNVTMILFEEFIATNLYLYDEPNKLQQYVSGIFRTRPGVVVMIGNTISRIVPYFSEWQLDNIPRQEQGTVEVYTFKTEETETRIGVFLCGSLNHNSGMFFGTSAKMIVGGEWERSEQPKLTNPREDYNELYRMVFEFSTTAKYLMTFLQLKSDHTKLLWYVEPKTTETQKNTRVISPTFNESRLYTQDFIPVNDRERVLMDYFHEGKIAYSDNLTGTEFERCLSQLNKRK